MALYERNYITFFYPSCLRYNILFESRTMGKKKRGLPLGYINFKSCGQSRNRFKKILLNVIVAGVVIAIIGFSVLLFNYANSPINSKNTTVLVNIPVGTSLSEVVKILSQADLVKQPVLFYSLIIIKRATRSIRAGEYEFNTSLTPSELIDKLSLGDMRYYYITISEGLSVREIATRLSAFNLINKEEFLELAKDKAFLESMDIKADSIEGYLFPDTYKISRTMSTRQIMRMMVDHGQKLHRK